MILTCKKNNIVELKAIWKSIFKDTDEYIELFFNEKVKPENTFVINENDKIVSMLYGVEQNMNNYKVMYICGVATLEQYRGRGYSKQLMKKAISNFKKRGIDLAILIPANKGLFNFYEYFGFKTYFYLNKEEFEFDKKFLLDNIKYTKQFDFEKLNFFYTSMNMRNYPKRQYKEFFDIYNCYKNLNIYDDGYLFYYSDKDILYILEHTFSNPYSYVADILKKNNLKKAIITNHIKNDDNDYAFAMMKILNNNINEHEFLDFSKNYINLMLN